MQTPTNEPRRISAAEVARVRAAMALAQGGKCAICQGVLGTRPPLDPVLDHDHLTGAIRAVLHRGCNSGLGLVERGAKRYGYFVRIIQFCAGLGAYLRRHEANVTGLIHPTHRTDDEKRILRNKRAAKSRAAKRAYNEKD